MARECPEGLLLSKTSVRIIGDGEASPPPKRNKWLYLPGPKRGSQEDSHFPRVGVGTACGGTRHRVRAGQPSRRGCTSGASFLIRNTRV